MVFLLTLLGVPSLTIPCCSSCVSSSLLWHSLLPHFLLFQSFHFFVHVSSCYSYCLHHQFPPCCLLHLHFLPHYLRLIRRVLCCLYPHTYVPHPASVLPDTILDIAHVLFQPRGSLQRLGNTGRHCVRKNKQTSASQSGAKVCNNLNARGKSGRDHITIIILFYLMRITCAMIIASRGLESTAECWTVWTGQRNVSGGRSVDSGGWARPLPASVSRTLNSVAWQGWKGCGQWTGNKLLTNGDLNGLTICTFMANEASRLSNGFVMYLLDCSWAIHIKWVFNLQFAFHSR